MSDTEFETYMTDRVDDQLKYFDSSSIKNQKAYRRLKLLAILCNILTMMTIALAFTVPEEYKVAMGIVALVLSTVVLGTYQLEEFQNYGAKWEKFRLVTEQIKSERFMFLNNAGHYAESDPEKNKRQFVETIEAIIRGTDITYFSLMVEPGKRLEKRLQQDQGSR